MKMKRTSWILFVGMIFILSGCDSIICPYRNLPDLGNGYRFETLGCKTLTIVNSKNYEVVDGEILKYAFDSTFILVSQRPWDSVPNIKTMTYSEANRAFNKSKFVQYWIINKKQKNKSIYNKMKKIATYSNVYGPFNKSTFVLERKQLGVPKGLILKNAKHN